MRAIGDSGSAGAVIRLAANKERHPDFDDATPEEAHQCVEFALALAQNLLSYLRASDVVWKT